MKRFDAESWIQYQSKVSGSNNTTSPSSTEELHKIAAEWNAALANTSSATERLRFIEKQGKRMVMSSSFGIHSNLMIDLVSRTLSNTIPLIWIDTGYCPPETYEFIERIKTSYKVDLRVYQSHLSPARMEALYGKLYENPSIECHKTYGTIRKVEPMNRALSEMKAQVIITGLRASQTSTRAKMSFVNVQDGRLKVCPVLDWSDSDVSQYFEKQQLQYHPLYYLGYKSVGDAHSSAPSVDDDTSTNVRSSRFHGIAEECGLHLQHNEIVPPPLPSSSISSKEFQIYGKASCQYCIKSKELLTQHQRTFKEFVVGKDIDIKLLRKIVGKEDIRTVPQIMHYGKTYIGGYNELQAWLEREETIVA